MDKTDIPLIWTPAHRATHELMAVLIRLETDYPSDTKYSKEKLP